MTEAALIVHYYIYEIFQYHQVCLFVSYLTTHIHPLVLINGICLPIAFPPSFRCGVDVMARTFDVQLHLPPVSLLSPRWYKLILVWVRRRKQRSINSFLHHRPNQNVIFSSQVHESKQLLPVLEWDLTFNKRNGSLPSHCQLIIVRGAVPSY